MDKIAAFLTIAVPLYFSPGPNNMILMASGAKFGLRRTLPHAAGVSCGFPVLVLLVGLGLGEIFTRFPLIKPIMLYGACGYFLYMAYQLLGLKINEMGARARPMRFIEGALFQVINPKAWVIATGLISVFVEPGAGRFQALMWLVAATFLLSPFSTLGWAVFGNRISAFLRKFGYERYLGWFMAALMVVAIVILLV